jgi:ketopantoate reductase
MSSKSSILLVGGGVVGTAAAYNLDVGGKAKVTAVRKSSYDTVRQHGFTIKSVDHGFVDGWKPTRSRYHV